MNDPRIAGVPLHVESTGQALSVRDSSGLRICSVNTAIVNQERWARLLSAAPDLYRAIFLSDDAHWTPAMRAAMAKAEGNTP